MSALKPLLDFLCGSRFEREVADAICVADESRDQEFWLGVHGRLLKSTSTTSFSCYPSIARCHVLCVAAVPECNETWSGIVLDELMRQATGNASFDSYVMGSQLGLFQAGKWLQEKKQKLLGKNFLSAMAKYCSVLFGKKCTPVNISGSWHDLDSARRTLDCAVKGYLRPESEGLIEQIKPEIYAMLVELQQFDLVVRSDGMSSSSGADRWLLDALVHGSLDVGHRNYKELVRASLALNA